MGLEVHFLPDDQLLRQPYADALASMGIDILAGKAFRCGGWKHWLREHGARIDVVFLHRPNIAPDYLSALRELLPQATLCYCGHDLRHWRLARQYQANGKRHLLRDARHWKKIEIAIGQRVDIAYFFSQLETATLRLEVPNLQTATIPLFPDNIVELESPPFAERAGLLFVGGFDHAPNVDAVHWFIDAIFPQVRAKQPSAVLHIVGANPPVAASEGIVLEGAVSDARLRDLYRTCRVVVAPLRFGAGIKGKVIEAMAHGLPTVTTHMGAEGIAGAQQLLCVTDHAA
jgi:glycosyltransferase involved in cell wall biosynthesis